MSLKKIFRTLGLTLASSALLLGCGASAANGKTLTVGVRADVMNFGYQNPDTGRYYGLEIDIAQDMAQRMGYQNVEFVTVKPENRKQLLLDGEVDCLAACYSISDTRLENFDFSPAYYTDRASVMVENSSLVETIEDLMGGTIGAMSGSNTAPMLAIKLQELGLISGEVISETDEGTQYDNIYIRQIPSYDELSEALEEGTVDAAAMDGSLCQTYLNDERHLLDFNIAEQNYGVATQKGSELSQQVSQTIQEMLDDGTIEELIDKWN